MVRFRTLLPKTTVAMSSAPAAETLNPSVETAVSPEAAPAPATAPSPVQASRALLKRLQEQFEVFRECRPLAIGIDKQLLAKMPDLEKKVLRLTLRHHTNSVRYLKSVEKGTHRFDLEGNQSDALTDEHRQHAAETLKERFKKDAERRRSQQAAEREAEAEKRRTEKLQLLAAKFSHR